MGLFLPSSDRMHRSLNSIGLSGFKNDDTLRVSSGYLFAINSSNISSLLSSSWEGLLSFGFLKDDAYTSSMGSHPSLFRIVSNLGSFSTRNWTSSRRTLGFLLTRVAWRTVSSAMPRWRRAAGWALAKKRATSGWWVMAHARCSGIHPRNSSTSSMAFGNKR